MKGRRMKQKKRSRWERGADRKDGGGGEREWGRSRQKERQKEWGRETHADTERRMEQMYREIDGQGVTEKEADWAVAP